MSKNQRCRIGKIIKLLGTKEQIIEMLQTIPDEVFHEVFELMIEQIEDEA